MGSPSGRPAAAGFVVSGLALVAYPMLRPWGPEAGLDGARDFASWAWPVAHVLGMVGFVGLALGLRQLAMAPSGTWPERRVRATETLAWIAVAFLLPYYGAEAFGLQAVGAYAVELGDAEVLAIAEAFRYGPLAITTFAVGLLLLLVVGIRLCLGFWRSGTPGRLGGLLAGAGAVTYLPQFFGSPAIRIAHGLLMGAGLVLLGVTAGRATSGAGVVGKGLRGRGAGGREAEAASAANAAN